MTMNTTSLDEIIRILKVTRAELAYSEGEDTHYLLNDMAQNLDNALYDLVEGIGADGSSFRGANSVAMDIALQDLDLDVLWDTSGEVPLLDSEWDL